MIRVVKNVKKIYLEGKKEYVFMSHILQKTGNNRKFKYENLGGGSHQSMIEKVIRDQFSGEKICILDNVNRTKGKIPLLNKNTELLEYITREGINLIISNKQFEDEIIDFFDIKRSMKKNSKLIVDEYLKNNNIDWDKFLENKIKDKLYIKNNLNKIKNENFKKLLQEILVSYSEDGYE